MTLRVSLLFGLAGFLVFFGPELFGWCKERVVSYKRRKDWKTAGSSDVFPLTVYPGPAPL